MSSSSFTSSSSFATPSSSSSGESPLNETDKRMDKDSKTTIKYLYKKYLRALEESGFRQSKYDDKYEFYLSNIHLRDIEKDVSAEFYKELEKVVGKLKKDNDLRREWFEEKKKRIVDDPRFKEFCDSGYYPYRHITGLLDEALEDWMSDWEKDKRWGEREFRRKSKKKEREDKETFLASQNLKDDEDGNAFWKLHLNLQANKKRQAEEEEKLEKKRKRRKPLNLKLVAE